MMDFYDADRSTHIREKNGKRSDWKKFDTAFTTIVNTLKTNNSSKLRVLVRPSSSPTVARLRQLASEKFPHARFHIYTPINKNNIHKNKHITFNQTITPQYNYTFTHTIISLDSDFLQNKHNALHTTKKFIRNHHI